jgi:hypothetical protein
VEKSDLNWRKASYSSNGGATCVEVADHANLVLVRNTKDRGQGPVLRFSPNAWRRFTGRVKRSLADLPPVLKGHLRVLRVPLQRVRGRFLVAGTAQCARRAGPLNGHSFGGVRPWSALPCAFLGYSCGGHPYCFASSPVICAVRAAMLGRQEWGSGGKPGTGPWFCGAGDSGFPPAHSARICGLCAVLAMCGICRRAVRDTGLSPVS